MIWRARRPLVITGRGARGAEAALVRLLDASGALYLDTQESRGLVPLDHPSFAGAVRAAGDDRGRSRRRGRAQARLSARLRLAGRVSERPLHPHRRHCGRADRQSPRRAGDPRHAGIGAGRDRRGHGQCGAEPRYRLGRDDAPAPAAARGGGLRRHARDSGRTARSIRAASSMPSPRSRPPITSRSPTAATC